MLGSARIRAPSAVHERDEPLEDCRHLTWLSDSSSEAAAAWAAKHWLSSAGVPPIPLGSTRTVGRSSA